MGWTILLFPFYRWRNWGMELINHSPRIPQPLSDSAGVGTQAVWVSSPCSQLYLVLPLWSINSPSTWGRQNVDFWATKTNPADSLLSWIKLYWHTATSFIYCLTFKQQWQRSVNAVETTWHAKHKMLALALHGSRWPAPSLELAVPLPMWAQIELLFWISLSSSVKYACLGNLVSR